MSRMSLAPDYCLFGAAGDTGNLGVDALNEATLYSIAAQQPNAVVLVFDNGRGRRRSPEGARVAHVRDGAWFSRRLYRSESLWTMRASSRCVLVPNRNVAAMRRSTAILDISGGDSFTDLYGNHRWHSTMLPKLIAEQIDRPLVLLPQTYGPFDRADHRAVASDVVARSHTAWARDSRAFDSMRELLGVRFDPGRHRKGVDVAFALPATPPPDRVRAGLPERSRGEVVVGLNVSGLIANDLRNASSQFSLSVDYWRLVHQTSRRLLDEVADRLVLVPHVLGTGWESDERACDELAAELADPQRVSVLPRGLTAGETKWWIAQLDWFCGTRMHSTVAALSTGVPAAAVAYSLKTQGVFETCGMGHAVVDARSMTTCDAIDRLVELASRRGDDRAHLADGIGHVVQRARSQFAEILDAIDDEDCGR